MEFLCGHTEGSGATGAPVDGVPLWRGAGGVTACLVCFDVYVVDELRDNADTVVGPVLTCHGHLIKQKFKHFNLFKPIKQ